MVRDLILKAAGGLRDVLPTGVRRAVFRAGRFLGSPPGGAEFPSVEGALGVLRERGFQPRTCVDVGAYRGEWTRMFRGIFPGSRVLMVEAQEGMRSHLEPMVAASAGAVALEIGLLGSVAGVKVPFNEMTTGSSVFAEASLVPRRVVEHEVRTLDGVLARRPEFGAVDFLKLDVQGYELQVLEGARETLTSTKAVLLEASLVATNAGCPLIAEVMGYMAGRGFRLADFCSQIRRTDGVLWQTDLLFLHETSGWLPDPRLTAANWPWCPATEG